MEHIYCGIKFPAPRNFERVRVDNVNFNENSAALKERILNEVLKTKDEISLVYLGNILADDEPICKQQNIRSGSTIHVLKKPKEEEIKTYSKFTEADVSRVVSLYRSLNSGNFHKISRPEVIKAIFAKHPELEKDIIALSFLKDPILLATLQNPDTVRKMAENHRALIEASDAICKALRNVKQPAKEAPPAPSFDYDLEDSSSSSGSEANSPQASTSAGRQARRITSELLRQSLQAAQSNQNSLANISQRNLSQASGISPSSSSASVPNRRNIISSSMFMSAINEVLQSRRSENEVSPSTAPAPSQDEQMSEEAPTVSESAAEEMQIDDEQVLATTDQADIEMIMSFQTQLRQMEEMGLKNKVQNIQALMVCNGNLEAAVNFVLAEMNLN